MAASLVLHLLALGLELQPDLHGVTGDIKRSAHGDEVVGALGPVFAGKNNLVGVRCVPSLPVLFTVVLSDVN